jgi:hypothetical protein
MTLGIGEGEWCPRITAVFGYTRIIAELDVGLVLLGCGF